nr:alpha/beta fold hydrolase [Ornithinimicrobium cryptoxanthini]
MPDGRRRAARVLQQEIPGPHPWPRGQHEGQTYLARRLGTTSGPQIVLVHGIGVASTYFRRLATVLAESAGVHVLELPGFGGAPKPSAPLSVEELAAVVNAYVRSAGLDRPVLVGHSMGSQVVVEAALQEPDRVLAVVGVGCVVDPRAPTAVQQGLRLLLDFLRETPSANWAVLKDYVRTGPRWFLATVPLMLAYRTEESVRRLQVPLLVVRGARDPIASRGWCEQLAQSAPVAQLVEIPRGAHAVMHTHPQAVSLVVSQLWASALKSAEE